MKLHHDLILTAAIVGCALYGLVHFYENRVVPDNMIPSGNDHLIAWHQMSLQAEADSLLYEMPEIVPVPKRKPEMSVSQEIAFKWKEVM